MKSRRRLTHVMRKNYRSVYPAMVIYCDTETHQIPVDEGVIRQELFFGIAQYRDYSNHHKPDEIIFREAGEFWDWVESKCVNHKRLYLLFHNTDFDFRVLKGFTELAKRGFVLKSIIADGGKWISDHAKEIKKDAVLEDGVGRNGRNPRYSLMILDTLNWFKSSLAALGETLGLSKLEFPGESVDWEEWVTYCRRDVEVLRLAFERYCAFLSDNDMGNFGVTLAKQSLNAYRHKFMTAEIQVHDTWKAINLERSAYFGGRTECFFIGHQSNEPLYKVDINSQYPYVMRNFAYPTQLIGVRALVPYEWWTHNREHATFIADCDVETAVPCVPHRFDDHLCFPTGSFHSALCEPEYTLALRMGAQLKIRKIAFYEKAVIFREWVDAMYGMRKRFKAEGNDQYQFFTKILMNSLYGKFGQRVEEWLAIETCDPEENWYRVFIDAETGKVHTCKALGGQILEKQGWKEGWDTFVAIAAFVTSYARAYLWRLIHRAGIGNVYYCDTDSLILNGQGYARLIYRVDPTELGYLKLEETSSQIHIYNLKDYEFAGDVKIKGVSKKAVKVGEQTFICEQWEHLTGAIHNGRAEEVRVNKVEKVLQRVYKKGLIQENGRVKPFELSNGVLQSV